MRIIIVDEHFEFSSALIENTAVTIGFFDGVHKGHCFLIDQLKGISKERGLASAVITFSEHPRKVLHSEYQPQLLNSFEEKIYRFSATGVDYCFVLDFTEQLSGISAQEFIQEKLAEKFRVKVLLIGYDHKFGKDRTGGFEEYRSFGTACGIDVLQAGLFSDWDEHVSSTSIRKLLYAGDVKHAASLLSYNYMLEGTVVHGNKMGREMGFPTANIALDEPDKVIPKDGIYATWVYFDDKKYKGMAYIGTRPSLFSQGELRVEVNLLDFSGDLYGKKLKVEFVDFIRNDIKFQFIDDLKIMLHKDREETLVRLGTEELRVKN